MLKQLTRVRGHKPHSEEKRKFEFTKKMRDNLFKITSKAYRNHYIEFEEDQIEYAELARDWEFNIDFVDEDGFSPLHYAC